MTRAEYFYFGLILGGAFVAFLAPFLADMLVIW